MNLKSKGLPRTLGIDVGSTTVKLALLDQYDSLVDARYERHHSDVRNKVIELLNDTYKKYGNLNLSVTFTGSGSMTLAKGINLPFVQEVVASTNALKLYHPETDVAIELGGEDAKIIFLTGGMEQRMNGTCAGGTGSFIDQMAALMHVTPTGLNELAKAHTSIYPIAARCGVFAKTDVQPLLNEGANREDIAASIFKAVVVQTISGLACGRKVAGNIAFLGGPLTFLPELRKQFEVTLKDNMQTSILPDNSEVFMAIGAGLSGKNESTLPLMAVIEKLMAMEKQKLSKLATLPALFKSDHDYDIFINRHNQNKVDYKALESFEGDCYLGIDAGSTTTKLVLIDSDNNILFSHYGSNGGSPLNSSLVALNTLYDKLPKKAIIKSSTVTGYGESILKEALNIDFGEVETIAHYKAAAHFQPNVDFILDIGGQDIKCISIKDGVIDNIMLNEACSSGCGSFLETFSQSLNLSIQEFVDAALFAKSPIDLGSRCTVFMNSSVKQAQNDGATVSDISAGLSYSVIKNALNKVIKISDPKMLGESIVVQGGTFNNNAVLRSFELLSERQVTRPNIAGLMGAFGAALIGKERAGDNTTLLSKDQLDSFTFETKSSRCKLCTNNCHLTVNHFKLGNGDKKIFITGNRCERGAGKQKKKNEKINLYHYKYQRLFDYTSLPDIYASRGELGIPRVLNMYEHYPFWHTLFTSLKFKVTLSDPSSKQLYSTGIETMPSESVCYPGKLVHGHIMNLVNKGIDTIFYPSIIYDVKEDDQADNHYNCPIVISYPDVIRTNVDILEESTYTYINPFLPYHDDSALLEKLLKAFKGYSIKKNEMEEAIVRARKEMDQFRDDIRTQGENALKELKANGEKAIVLAGRPYHVDPEINHGISEAITAMDLAVLTEDSIAHLGEIERPLRVLDQWTFHSRMYAAASFVAKRDDLELVQLNSFGCGVDAITTDQVKEILERHHKIYTTVKIDEGSNIGAIKIRLRSLKAVMEERTLNLEKEIEPLDEAVPFTKEMRKQHTILAPEMSPIHFQFIEHAFENSGYRIEIPPLNGKHTIDVGLKYVNNDACYPALIVIGQLIEALKSGAYDTDNVSVIITQTGGGCRASNYIGLLRKALKDAGYPQVPVISLNGKGMEKNPGFKPSASFLNRNMMAITYGDLMMNVLYRTRPYEAVEGSANALAKKFSEKFKKDLKSANYITFKKNVQDCIRAFDALELKDIIKPRVGLVGEILVKFHPTANNNIVDLIENEGCEAVMPPLTDFFLYTMQNKIINNDLYVKDTKGTLVNQSIINLIRRYQKPYIDALKKSNRFDPPSPISEIANGASDILSLGHQTGEGWFLTGEMVELIHQGVENIVCMQPFGCLPNHVTGKAMIKPMRKMYKNANIVAVDYDPGACEINQLNRIKLMINQAFTLLNESEEVKKTNKKDTQDTA